MMVISTCSHEDRKKHGRDCNGNQRFRCKLCGATFIDHQPRPLGDLRMPMDKAVAVLKMLLEGVSVRATERLTGVSKKAILRLLVLVGNRARLFWIKRMNGIQCDELQVDEIWSFIAMKERTRKRLDRSEEFGDCYVFTAIDPNSKLMVNWHCGKRDYGDAEYFCEKLARNTAGRMQITTDGFKPYSNIMVEAFRARVDFAQLIKIFGTPRSDGGTYSPAEIKGTRRRVCMGNPDPAKVSTSIVERSNLTLRMRCRRFTRLTNAHSKTWQNHEAAVAIVFMAYNFVTIHSTLKTTPAVQHGLTDHAWSFEEMLDVLKAYA